MKSGRPVRAFLHVNTTGQSATVAFLLRDRDATNIYFGNQLTGGTWNDLPNNGFRWQFNYKNSAYSPVTWPAQAPVDFAWHHDAIEAALIGQDHHVHGHLSQATGDWGKEMYNVEISLQLLELMLGLQH